MATGNTLSHSEFNTGQLMPTNAELRDTYFQKVVPEQNNFKDMNEVSFLIQDTDTAWIDPSEMWLELTLKFESAAGTAFGNTDLQGAFLENNLLHTLFSTVELEVQGNPIRTDGNYAYRAYIDTVINATTDTLKDLETFQHFFGTAATESLSAAPYTTNANNEKGTRPSIHSRQSFQTKG